jgi:DNA-binding IclR family transcriptional regulator
MAEMKVQSLDRTFGILRTLAREAKGLTLAQIADAPEAPPFASSRCSCNMNM